MNPTTEQANATETTKMPEAKAPASAAQLIIKTAIRAGQSKGYR